MRSLLVLSLNLLMISIRLLAPGGYRKLIAENLALRQQLICQSRHSRKTIVLKPSDRIIFALLASFISRTRMNKIAVLIRPATILKFHRALINRKYQILFGSKHAVKRGRPKYSQEIVCLVLDIKRKNPSFGCPRIAMLVTNATGIAISEHTVRRILKKHFKPRGDGPSWLSFIGSQKDSLWSLDFFRCESISLKTHWIMLVMDQFTREIIGLKAIRGDFNGPLACFKFNQILGECKRLPQYLSTDNDPIFTFDRWKINLEMHGVREIKSVPDVPCSHPFVERCIGTIRREYLDQTLFWSQHDLQQKLNSFQRYYNEARSHYSLKGLPPQKYLSSAHQDLRHSGRYKFARYCNGAFSIPIAA